MNFPNFDEYLKVSEKLDTSIFGFEVWNNVNEDSDGLPKDKNEALEKAKRIVELVKLKVTKNFEWFKPYLDIMPIVPRFGAGSVGPDGVGTMATNGAEIFYDPIFVLRQYEKGKVDFAKEVTAEIQKAGPIKANFKGWKWWSDYVCFIIIHEIMHNSLKHFKRSSKIASDYLNENEIHTLWNLAQDYEINRIIANQTDVPLPLPQGVVYHKSGPFAVPADEQDFYEKSTSERIFWRLFRNIENERKKSSPQPQQQQQQGQQGQGQQGQQGQGQQGQGQQGQGQQGQGQQGQQGQGQGQQSQPQQGQQGNQPQQGKSGGGQGRRQVQVGDKVKIKRTGKIGVVKSVNPDGTFDIDVEPVNEAVFPKDFFTYLDSITGSYNRDEFIPISDDSNNGGDDEGEESGDQEASGEEQGEGGSEEGDEEGDEGENNGNGQQGSKKGKGDEGEEDYDENSNERIGKSEETDLDDDKLDNEYVNKIEGAIKDDSWDIGNPTANVGGSAGEAEERVWDISKIDNDIDEANRKVGRMEAEREEKTKSEKGRGKGEGSTFRDRIVIEGLARVNWGAIFKTRLTEYSKDKAKRIPYHKKFVGNKMLRPRITSKSYAKDVLPETNILIDTSSSLSYRELGVILNEIKNSVTYAKIKKVNLILWHTRAYYTNSYSNVDSKVMMKMMMDINQHWQGGGTELVSAYRKMKQKGWTNKFTIILSDGWVEDHKTDSEAKRLAAEVLDLNNTISGVIFPNKSVSMSDFKQIADRMPGEKIPIFLDTDRFS